MVDSGEAPGSGGRRNRRPDANPLLEDCEVKPFQPIKGSNSDTLTFIAPPRNILGDDDDDESEEVSPYRGPVTVKVLDPFLVAHNGTAYYPNAIATVPASVAEAWLKSKWVTDVD
jgi:hypothetical protein